MPFNSQEFREFAANYEFEVTTSSTSYPQSISEAENAIKPQIPVTAGLEEYPI